MEGTNNLKVTHQFPSLTQQGYSSNCGMLFDGNVGGQGTTTVCKNASTGQYFIQKEERLGSSILTRNYILAVDGSGSLYVTGSGVSSRSSCYFAMNSKAGKISLSIYF